MKLKYKISIIIFIIWAAMVSLFYYGSQHIILSSYVTLENKILNENLDRADAALDQSISSVEFILKDWSIWDDTYQFAQDKNKQYIKSTLTLSSIQTIKMDIILYYDVDGKLIHSVALNQDRTMEISLPKGLLDILTPKSKLVNLTDIHETKKGMISIPSGILLIASHSIINSDGEGPGRGTLIMAKFLTNAVLDDIENLVKEDITIFRIPQAESLNEVATAYKDLLTKGNETFVKSETQLFGYRFLNDINGKPLAILKINLPRTVYQIGIETTRYSNITVFIYSILITAVLWLLLQFLIVKRIEKLGRHLNKQGADDKFFSKTMENISDEVSSVATLYHHATHDPLTGLANRNLLYQAFNHYAPEIVDDNKKILIILIDIDHLKRINDTLGHDFGDQLLIVTAKRLASSLRDDDIAARLGGDEFVIMLVDIEKDQIEAITKRIFTSINRTINHDDHEIYLSSSMGVCIYPDDGSAIETLIKQADVALYHAKEHGRNHYQFYSESLNETINRSHQNEIELQYAIDQKQFCLYYQPIYDLRTKQIASLEALIRWNHPTQGLLGPADIIPIAERTELIHQIGAWVFKTACMQIKEWENKGLPVVPVAVNVSSLQMREGSFSEPIINALQESSLDSHLLEVEITETGFIDITPRLLSELEGLKSSGIKLTIDDFGTGYAGLGYLRSLPVGKLKIDQSFVRDIHTDPGDKAITLAIIAIAHQLNLKVTAEGVENIEQYNFLCYHQVDEVQGYFLSPPLSAEDCERLLSGEQPHHDIDNIK